MEDSVKKEKYKDCLVLYSIVRGCLNMSAGKTAAQVGHGVGQIYDLMDHYFIHSKPFYVKICDDFLAWKRDSFRKVVLHASELEWLECLKEIPSGYRVITTDGGFTELPPNTDTVITVVPILKSERFPILTKLKTL